MKHVEASGARLSAIGLGTWQFGSSEWGYGSDYDSREAAAILNRALDLGITLIDTAEIYGFGRSEKIIGKALGKRRDEAFIASQDPSGAAGRTGRRATGRREPSASRNREARSLPAASTEPARPAHGDDAGAQEDRRRGEDH